MDGAILDTPARCLHVKKKNSFQATFTESVVTASFVDKTFSRFRIQIRVSVRTGLDRIGEVMRSFSLSIHLFAVATRE